MLRTLPRFPLLPAVLSVFASAAAPQDRRFDDEALQPLAARLASYAEARAASRGVDDARAALAAELEALATEEEHPLARPSDLGRAVWLSKGYGEAKLKKGKVAEDVFEHGSFAGEGMELAYRVPKKYDARGASYPLILAIPARNETPAEHLRARWTLPAILDGAVLLCPEMPRDRDWDRVMVAGRPGGLSHVLTALRFAAERFAVDFDRVYVVGHGKGVPAAVAVGNYGPQRFAGVAGRAGEPGEQGPENFSNLPTYFAGGGAKAAAFERAVRDAGFDNCRLAPTGDEQDLWDWIQANPRRTYPTRVTLAVGTPFPTRAYWLRVAPTASDARMTATIERGTNTVALDGHGVSHVTLYLNDALVDLDQPLRVLRNGAEQEVAVERGFLSTLDLLADGTSDAASVYVAEAVLELTEDAIAPRDDAPPADEEYQERLAGAGLDVERLWELHLWCESTDRAAKGRAVLRRLLRVDPDHEAARQALGHLRSRGGWFVSRESFERFEEGQDEAAAKSRGYVKHKGVWMHPADRARASKGLVRDRETGLWLSAEERRKLAKGWVRQDLDWIPPEEAALADDGLWRVDGEWFDLRVANRRRAKIDSMWRIPLPAVLLHTTADRDVSLRAAEHMTRALADLRKVFGAEPELPLSAAVLRDEEQFDRFAFGDPDGRRRATHAGRRHLVHYGFFAESWFPPVEGKREFRGMGVCYWDTLAPHGDLYGVHSARLAIGLSYVDALDPSPKAVRGALPDGPGREYYDAYRAEKTLPEWLRYGGAVYAERFFEDTYVEGDGDRWWTRKWSVDNLKGRGGLRPLDEVFAFRLDPDDRDDALKLLIEAGLVVAFAVDGGCAPVDEAHAKLKAALASGRFRPSHAKELREAIGENRPALEAFAGL